MTKDTPKPLAGKGSGRGGPRPGAGRKRENAALLTFRAPQQMAQYISAQPSKSDFIKDCIARRIRQEQHGLQALGLVVPATEVEDLAVHFFGVGMVAGFPIPIDNDERGQRINLLQMLCPHLESCYLIRVKGHSMVDANIHDGDIVIVDKSNRQPTPHQVAVCELNGEYTLKRFEMRQGVGWLIPANPDFPEIKVMPHDDFSIWGVVTYVIHQPSDVGTR